MCLVDNVLGLRIKWIFNFRRIKGFLHQNKLQVSVVLYLLMTLMTPSIPQFQFLPRGGSILLWPSFKKYQLGPQKLILVQITGIRCTERLLREQRTGTTDNKERGRTDRAGLAGRTSSAFVRRPPPSAF